MNPLERGTWLHVSIPEQTLFLMQQRECCVSYPVATSSKGPGEQQGSHRTPRGWHRIRAKIGAGLPEGAVLVGRRPTGEIYSEDLRQAHPERLWILTRILWLSGLEPGVNRLGAVDTMRRFIYIHGCPDSTPMGTPGSIGCIEMRNRDIVALFERIGARTPVLISD